MPIETLPTQFGDPLFAEKSGVPSRVLDLGGSLSELVELDLGDSSVEQFTQPISTIAGSEGS